MQYASSTGGRPGIVLVGAGIMSATLAALLKELDPTLEITIFEVLDGPAQESSNAWNNAGTSHKEQIEEWFPLVMEGRSRSEEVAATRMITGGA